MTVLSAEHPFLWAFIAPWDSYIWQRPFWASGTVLTSRKDFCTCWSRGLQAFLLELWLSIRSCAAHRPSDHIAQTSDRIFFSKVIYEFYLIALHTIPLNDGHYPSSELWSRGRWRVMAKVELGYWWSENENTWSPCWAQTTSISLCDMFCALIADTCCIVRRTVVQSTAIKSKPVLLLYITFFLSHIVLEG